MSLKQRLLDGETLSPGNGIAKSSLTSAASTLRAEGYDVENIGNYTYRVVMTEVDGGLPIGSPPIPGSVITLELKVIDLRLSEDDESLVVTCLDPVGREIVFSY